MKEFSKRLSAIRKEHGYSQKFVADELQLSSAQVLSNYENNNREPDYQTLCNIAQFYGVSTDYLLGQSDERVPQAKDFSTITGLTERAISKLQTIHKFPNIPNVESPSDCLSEVISSDRLTVFCIALASLKKNISDCEHEIDDMLKSVPASNQQDYLQKTRDCIVEYRKDLIGQIYSAYILGKGLIDDCLAFTNFSEAIQQIDSQLPDRKSTIARKERTAKGLIDLFCENRARKIRSKHFPAKHHRRIVELPNDVCSEELLK